LLYHLYRRIPHGGIIVFDDYGHWIGAKRAVDEFLKESGETLHTTTTTQSFVVKTQDIHEEALFFVGGIEPVGVAQWAEQARLPQQALYDALRYFLYGSLRSSRFRYLFRRGGGLRAAPLAKVVEAFERVHVPRGRWPSLPTNSSLTDTAFAEFLGEAYHVWEEILSQADKGQTTHCRLPLGKRYEEWIREGGNSSKYRPVHSLRSLLCLKRSEDLFLRAIVHGSVATLDDTPGFSDLDLAFMVRSSALKSSKSLLDLRKLASAILIQTYAFDPFMHHGPYYLAEIDLNWYPEAMLPMVLFSHGVDLLDGSAAVEVWTRPSFDMTLQMLDRFEKSFENWASSPFVLADSYALEWVLGNAMILPALYLQGRTGRFRYKRDTFPLAQGGFSSEEWEPIRLASAVRTSLGGRPKPSELLVRLAQWLEWPGLLQAWERRRPASLSRAQKAAKTLGADYPQRVLLLLRAMKKKLSETRSQAGTV
jgi:predicted nucleotidyltransferase